MSSDGRPSVKPLELSDVILQLFHVTTHTSSEWALQALEDISNTATERFNLYRNIWAQWVGSNTDSEARIEQSQFTATGRHRRLPGVMVRRLTCAGPGPAQNGQPATNRIPLCHASQNRGEYNSADSRRNIPQVRGGGEGGEVQHLTASGKKARITAPKGLRKRLTGHAGRP